MSERMPHMLRADARQNRDRIIEAARALFAQRGTEITMREIARRAGVGPATLYRRFPTKKSLIDEAFTHELQACRGIVHEGCSDPDPWRGLRTVIERTVVLNVGNQGFVQAFLSSSPVADVFTEHRTSLLRMLAKLIGRAQADGTLRRDLVIDDLVLILAAAQGLTAAPLASREATARRFASLTIDALQAADTNSALPPLPIGAFSYNSAPSTAAAIR